ncbi:MAG: response regulator transcription factor [Rhodospirillales bacterium]|nr:response regulator transcription factor [Rhodospirillales bacterium]
MNVGTLNSSIKQAVFVVEDDFDVGRLICRSLDEFEFTARHFRTGGELLKQLKREEPALCIVDLGLPDIDGIQVVREIEERHDCAILILTGRQGVSDRVLGLELGADDYMVKPFEPRELVARVRSILRRWHRAPAKELQQNLGKARFADWIFDADMNRLCSLDGEQVDLSASEAALLGGLLRSPKRILSRDQLLGERSDAPFDRSIDVRISRLRRKLGDDPHHPRLIKTVYGAGYILSATVTWD